MNHIAEMLNTMRVENQNNTDNFEKILTTINSKLDLMAEDCEATDLLRVYIAELKNVVQDNHHNALDKFEDINDAVKNVLSYNNELVKNSDLENFNKSAQENFAKVCAALTEQKDKLENLQAKFEQDFDNLDFNRHENFADLKEQLAEILFTLKNLIEQNPLKSLEELSFSSTQISDDINDFRNEFKQAVESNLENSSKIVDGIVSINEQILTCENSLKENSKNNFEGLKSLFENIAQKLSFNSDVQKAQVLETATDIKRSVEQVQNDLSQDIKGVNDLINNDVLEILSGLKELAASKEDTEAIEAHIQNLEDNYLTVVTVEDFANFKTDFADFLQKILDNADILSLNADVNKEQITHILEKIDTLNYSDDFKNLADRITDFKASFDNNSKMNYENIVNEINNLKEDLNGKINTDIYGDKFDDMKSVLSDLCANIQFLRDFSTQKSVDVLDEVSSQLHNISDDIKENINNNTTINSDELKNNVREIVTELSDIRIDFNQRYDANIFNISSGFDNVNVSLENIISSFNGLGSLLNETSQKNYTNLSSNLDEISLRVDELKHVITELLTQYSDKEILDKLREFDSFLMQSADDYNTKFALLQDKITEFAQIVENSAADNEGKIAASLEEISDIKAQLASAAELLKNVHASSDEKASEILCRMEVSLEHIIQTVETSAASMSDGFNTQLKDNLVAVEDKLVILLQAVENAKSEASDKSFVENIEQKIDSVKDELGLLNTDIADALQCKTEEIVRAFENVKECIDAFSSFDFSKVIYDLKHQMDTSLENFNTEICESFAENAQLMSKIEQAYKETFNKMNVIEECVAEKIQNNLELLNAALQSSSINIKNNFDEKLIECADELKEYFVSVFDKSRNEEQIVLMRDELSAKLDSITQMLLNQNGISSEISNLEDKLKNYVSEAGNNIIDKCNVKETESLVQALHEKFDIFALSNNSEEVMAILDENQESVCDNFKQLKDAVETVSNKVDILASFDDNNDEIFCHLDEIADKNDKVSEMLSALHAKVDVLANDSSDFDFVEELDDIKELIYEQRKFFETSSDEKTAAIDKYLRDVLLKLDNVDVDKNAEDIKETIINTLVSLVNEISFVEETEDIKDFVEEKTEAINKNLIEVQNQLKQITNSDDGFDYSYTLQDVESDIARLRLAISNMSDTDFDGFSDDIKKIATTVETLSSSLTQEQSKDLKNDIEKLNEDILSISSRTNKLLLTSDESYKALNDGLNNFSNIIYKLEDRINYLDNTEINERIERKIDNIHSLTVETVNSDKVFHQVMTYLGEWIDSTTDNISSISEKTSQISNIKEQISELREIVPQKAELLEIIENKFIRQEERIESLETKLEKVLLTLEEKDDMMLSRKVDKIEKMLSTLGANIEKLASYVDEE